MTIERFMNEHGRVIALGLMWLILLILWIPIFFVSFMSFAEGGVLSFPPDGLTLGWYREFAATQSAFDAIITTVQVGIIATPISVFLAILLAYGLVRYDFRGKSLLYLLITLPMLIPLVVVGIALALFFGLIGLGGGFWAVVLAHVVRTLPFAALIIIPTFMQFDKTLEEAAMDLGSNEIETFVRVTLPNILPGVVAAALLVFATSFNEFMYTYFVRDIGIETLPIYLWTRIEYSITPEINVISVVFLIVAISLVLIAAIFTRVERLMT